MGLGDKAETEENAGEVKQNVNSRDRRGRKKGACTGGKRGYSGGRHETDC